MNWLKAKDTNFVQIERVGDKTEKYAIKLSPRTYIPQNEEDDRNILYLEIICKGKQSVFDLKQHLINLIREYDSSDEVNVFYVNGNKAWIDKATRVGLINSCNVIEANGGDKYTVYFNGTPFTLKTSTIKEILNSIELYAMLCYSITEQHLAQVEQLDTEADILSYDITTGYPEKITLLLN